MDNNYNQNNQYNQYTGYNQNNQYTGQRQFNQYTGYGQQPMMTPEQWQWYQYQLAQDNKKANIMCLISIACTLGAYVLAFVIAITQNTSSYFSYYDAPDVFRKITESVNVLPTFFIGILEMAGFVLMIIARVKYPKNTFAKVLMWIYIVFAIIYVLIIIALVAACVWLFSQCIP